MKQAAVAEMRSQLHDLGQTQLPGLLQDMATLQVTKILHGDYDLKIARQDYFTSKQDKVFSHMTTVSASHMITLSIHMTTLSASHTIVSPVLVFVFAYIRISNFASSECRKGLSG